MPSCIFRWCSRCEYSTLHVDLTVKTNFFLHPAGATGPRTLVGQTLPSRPEFSSLCFDTAFLYSTLFRGNSNTGMRRVSVMINTFFPNTSVV